MYGVSVIVAYYVEGRSREQCAKRWDQLYPTNNIRGRWQDHEDAVSLFCCSHNNISMVNPSQSYRALPDIWDYTLLPGT